MAAHDTESFYAILGNFGLSVVQKEKKTGEPYQTYYLHDLSNISDQSKDSNGKIRSLAKKDQLPAMRSYRQKGYSIEEISRRIKSKGVSHMEEEISAAPPDTGSRTNRRYSQALNTFDMKKNKQKDKSL